MGMKPCLILVVTLLCTGISHAQRKPVKTMSSALEPQLKKFFAEKRVQARALAKEENKEPSTARGIKPHHLVVAPTLVSDGVRRVPGIAVGGYF